MEPRVTSKGFHILAGQAWRAHGERQQLHSPLVYAALEFRCAIERLVLELYVVMKDVKPEVEKVEGIKSFKSLMALLHEDAGNGRALYRALAFNQVYVDEVIGTSHRLAIPKVGVLQSYWSRLSDYCHRQVTDTNTWDSNEWVAKGYALLNEVESHLWEVGIEHELGWLHAASLPGEMADERARFIDGEESPDTLRRRLRLIKPVIEGRVKGRARKP